MPSTNPKTAMQDNAEAYDDEQDLLDRDSLNTINNDQLTQALSFANKLASITVTRKGANPPWHEELY